MGARILVIEDNPPNLELMSYLLRAFGHEVFSAMDGEEGLEAARRGSPDLIVCDIQIPKLNGLEVARRLKSHPALSWIPLVAVTAFAMVGDRDKVLAAGFDGYIPKPIMPETFVKQVESFLPKRNSSIPERIDSGAPELPEIRPNLAVILVVDNSHINIELVRSILEPSGYQVISSDNVDAGLELALRLQPDLIVSDVHMPRKDGYDFLRAAKADPQLSAIPFIFLSSTVWRDVDPKQALSMGALKFVIRPIEPDALLDEIKACLRPEHAS